MKTVTFTANDSSTLATGFYGTSSWRDGAVAYQGAYNVGSTSDSHSQSRVGVIYFKNADSILRNMIIKSIKFEITATGAGSSSDDKLIIHKSLKQTLDKTVVSKNYIGDELGYIKSKFFENTLSYEITNNYNNDETNDLFDTLKQYFEEGNNCLVIYNGETAPSTKDAFSSDYLGLTSVTMTVEYEENYINYNNYGTATKCAVYYNDNGEIRRCTVYYNDNGTPVRV